MGAATTVASPRRLGLPLRALGDERLVGLAAAGNQGALAVIFERHHQALYRYCRALLGSAEDAEDALQSAMARVVRALPGETRELALKPWLYRIAHNEAMRIAGRRRPQATLDEAPDVAARSDTEDRESRERLDELVRDMRELSERQRGALVLFSIPSFALKGLATVVLARGVAAGAHQLPSGLPEGGSEPTAITEDEPGGRAGDGNGGEGGEERETKHRGDRDGAGRKAGGPRDEREASTREAPSAESAESATGDERDAPAFERRRDAATSTPGSGLAPGGGGRPDSTPAGDQRGPSPSSPRVPPRPVPGPRGGAPDATAPAATAPAVTPAPAPRAPALPSVPGVVDSTAPAEAGRGPIARP